MNPAKFTYVIIYAEMIYSFIVFFLRLFRRHPNHSQDWTIFDNSVWRIDNRTDRQTEPSRKKNNENMHANFKWRFSFSFLLNGLFPWKMEKELEILFIYYILKFVYDYFVLEMFKRFIIGKRNVSNNKVGAYAARRPRVLFSEQRSHFLS